MKFEKLPQKCLYRKVSLQGLSNIFESVFPFKTHIFSLFINHLFICTFINEKIKSAVESTLECYMTMTKFVYI